MKKLVFCSIIMMLAFNVNADINDDVQKNIAEVIKETSEGAAIMIEQNNLKGEELKKFLNAVTRKAVGKSFMAYGKAEHEASYIQPVSEESEVADAIRDQTYAMEKAQKEAIEAQERISRQEQFNLQQQMTHQRLMNPLPINSGMMQGRGLDTSWSSRLR